MERIRAAILADADSAEFASIPVPDHCRAVTLHKDEQAAYAVHRNAHQGKVGVLALSPELGLGVRDPETRARFDPQINRFRIDLRKTP